MRKLLSCLIAGSALMLLTLSGCAKDYSFSRAVYDGVQTRNQLQASPTEQLGKPDAPNYDQYNAERNRLQ